ncbi:MAG: hypothetical protein Q7S75_02310 [bacterium]|nr:hypothetical protein [bacterium]
MKRLFCFLRARAQSTLFAAFVPLADVTQSGKLSTLYNSDQNLSNYINSMFKIAISAGAIIAVIRLGVAGYKYMGGDIWHKKEEAKEDIREIFFGLLLLLSIWIILHQINPNILNLNIVFPETKLITAPPSSIANVSPADQRVIGMITSDENRVWNILRSGGISRNKGQCTSTMQTNCTSLGGLGAPAVNGLLNLKSTCGCAVTVTGGTEWWLHTSGTSHGPGNSVVDLAPSSSLNDYLLGPGTAPSSGTQVTKNGARYKYETTGDNGVATGNHWHVVF